MTSITGELLDFLAQKFENPLQVGSMCIILAMIAYTVNGAHLAARTA